MKKQIFNKIKISFFAIIAAAFPLVTVFAHEEGTEITNIAEADWVGPLVAVLIISAAIVIAKMIRSKSE